MARLAIVLSHPVQYFSPWFRHIATYSQVEIRVFYLWEAGVRLTRDRGFGNVFKWDVPLLDGYDFEFVTNASHDPGTHHFRGLDNPDLVSRIAEWQPDAILMFGYNYRSHLRVLLSWRLRTVPIVLRGDSHDMGRQAGVRASGAALLRSLLFRRFSGFLSVGSANREYLLASGVPDSRIHHVPHCVDNARFRESGTAATDAAVQWRDHLGISASAIVLLFVGKLEPKKAPELLLSAFLQMQNARPRERTELALVFVGSGALEPTVREMAGDRLGRDVFMVPFQNQTMMPTVYGAADVLVLPSNSVSETWGLVVNEAMNLAVPAIVSSNVGCGPDLVITGETGWVFRSGDLNALVSVLEEATADRDRLRSMGARARCHIDAYSYDVATSELEAAVERVVGERRPAPSMLST